MHCDSLGGKKKKEGGIEERKGKEEREREKGEPEWNVLVNRTTFLHL